MNGISFLIKKTLVTYLTPSSMGEHNEKMAIDEPGSKPSSDTKSAGTLNLNLWSSRTLRDKFGCL